MTSSQIAMARQQGAQPQLEQKQAAGKCCESWSFSERRSSLRRQPSQGSYNHRQKTTRASPTQERRDWPWPPDFPLPFLLRVLAGQRCDFFHALFPLIPPLARCVPAYSSAASSRSRLIAAPLEVSRHHESALASDHPRPSSSPTMSHCHPVVGRPISNTRVRQPRSRTAVPMVAREPRSRSPRRPEPILGTPRCPRLAQ